MNMNPSADRTGAPDTELITGFAVAHPWLADAMGHLTTRNYMAFFDDASWQCFAELGYRAQEANAAGWGWADVKTEIEYASEVPVGALLVIRSRVTRLGRSSIAIRHRLIDRSGDRLCATMDTTTVCFDLSARRSRPIPEDLADIVASRFPDVRAATVR